jgi:two-component system, OmpR family, heavy metal sensor histidine kinase CusS
MTLKFKHRIALFNTIAVAATTALVFVVIYWVVRTTAFAHLDSDINQEMEEVMQDLHTTGDSISLKKMTEWDEAEHSKVEVNPTFLQIVDRGGRVIFHSQNLLKDQFLYNPNNAQSKFYNSEINGQWIRLGQFPIRNAQSAIIGQLTIAISQQESHIILHNLLLVLLIAYPLVLGAQYFASAIAAGRAISPVNRLIQTASRISDASIDTRLELPARHDELYELTRTINELLGRIETSLLQQKQFTSDASHEIRTPLAAIRGTLEVLVRKQREPAVYQEKIAGILAQVDRIDRLLEQLLQLARLETGTATLKSESIQLQSTLRAIQDKWQIAAAEKTIRMDLQIVPEATVTCDRLYLEMILDNLVNNAIKYGRPQGHVRIAWDAKTLTLSVQDDGIGIAASQLPMVLERFFRADASRSSAIQGSGLGLAIVKKLADLQQITLQVASIEGEGSTFFLQFPR